MRSKDIGLEVAADPRLLTSVRGMVRSYVGSFGFEEGRIDEVVLAVDEACANTIRHAYGGACDKSFRLTLRSSAKWVEIELRDGGRPAPSKVLEAKNETPPSDVEEVAPGGLGVPLIYGVFDKVDFCPGKTRGNCVTMKLKRPSIPAQSSRQEGGHGIGY